MASSLRDWYNRVSGSHHMARAKHHAMATGHALRQGGEGIIVGGVLGAMHSELPTGLDYKKVPVDAAIGVIGLMGGVAMAHEEIGADLRNAGAAAVSVFGFRKAYELMAEKRRQRGALPGGALGPAKPAPGTPAAAAIKGEFGGYGHANMGYGGYGGFGDEQGAEDPIIAAARLL